MQQDTSTPGDLLNLEPEMVRAGTGRRLGNYLIDLLFFYLLFFLLAIVAAAFMPTLGEAWEAFSEEQPLLDRLLMLLIYALYMGGMEALFRGKSFGKFFTQTRAIQQDGQPLTLEKAFARGFCRAVPFAAFSALGTPCNPWQDAWTHTLVIDERVGGTVRGEELAT